MRRVLDLRFLAVFTGILLALGVTLHFLHAHQMARNADALLRQGESALEEGNVDQALVYFSHYLTFRRDQGALTREDGPALANYALTLAQQAQTTVQRVQAVLALEEALRIDPSLVEVRRRLALQQIELGRIAAAIPNLQALTKQAGKDAEVHHMLGWCYEAEKRYAEAAAEFRRAIALDPRRLSSYDLLAETVLKLPPTAEDRDAMQEARAVLDGMVRANPKDPRAYLMRARFREDDGDKAAGDADLNQALALAPTDPAVVLAAARRDVRHEQEEQARRRLQDGLKIHPKNADLIKGLAGLDMRAQRNEAALALLHAAVRDLPAAWDLQVLLADLLLDEGQVEEAEATITGLRRYPQARLLADYLEGRVLVRRNHWNEALALLEKVRAEMHPRSDWSSRLDVLLGICRHHLGDVPHMLAAFRRAVQRDPTWPEARLGLAHALLLAGRLEESLRELELLEKSQTPPRGLGTVLGRALLEKTLRLPPDQRVWERTQAALDRAASEEPASLEVLVLRSRMLDAMDDSQAARTLLEKAVADHPKEPILRLALADFEARRSPAAAGAILQQAEKDLGDLLVLRLARAGLLLREEGIEVPARLRALGLETARFTGEEKGILLRHLATTASRLGRTTEAEGFWRRLAEEQPKDLGSRLALFDLALERRDFAEARRLHQELRGLDAETGRVGNYATAALLVAQADARPEALAEADRLLKKVRARHNDWPRLPLLQARIEERLGHFDRALDHRLEALELGEDDAQLTARVVRALLARKRFLDADAVLTRAQERRTLPLELQRLAARTASALGDKARADLLADAIEKTAGSDYRDLLWLGKLRNGLGQEDRAEQLFRSAAAVHPRTPEVWVALIRHLHRTGKDAEARKVLEAATSKVPERQRAYVAALGAEALGDLAEAESRFDQALAAAPDDFILRRAAASFFRRIDQPAKALHHYARLLAAGSTLPEELVPGERRWAALLLAEQDPSPQSVARASRLVDRNGPGNAADERVQALLDTYRPGQGRDGLRRFREALKQGPAEPEELLFLARAHARLNDPVRAGEILTDLLAGDPDNPQLLAAAIRSLLRSEDSATATKLLDRLARLEPNSSRTLELRRQVGTAP